MAGSRPFLVSSLVIRMSSMLTCPWRSDTICDLSSAGGIQLPSTALNPEAGSYQEVPSDNRGVTEYFTAGGQNQASPELQMFSQELSDLLSWPLYSTDLGRSPDYRPFDGSLVGDAQWYQSSLYSGFTNLSEHGTPFTNTGDTFTFRDPSFAIPLNTATWWWVQDLLRCISLAHPIFRWPWRMKLC
jgi:hypothetical protein